MQPLQIEIDSVRGQTCGLQPLVTSEPSHIHIPRPSRVRLERAQEAAAQPLLEDAA